MAHRRLREAELFAEARHIPLPTLEHPEKAQTSRIRNRAERLNQGTHRVRTGCEFVEHEIFPPAEACKHQKDSFC